MNEEEIKKKMQQRLLQEQFQDPQMQQLQEQQQLEATLKMINSRVLDEKARERLANLKMVKPDIAMQLSMYLANLYRSGQIRSRITDEQLVAILKKLTETREIRIKRK